MMNTNKFIEWLKNQPLNDKLVYMRYKYSWEDKWTYSNEYLRADADVMDYTWDNDWDEGQEDVEFLGCIDIDKINIPLFDEQEGENNEL